MKPIRENIFVNLALAICLLSVVFGCSDNDGDTESLSDSTSPASAAATVTIPHTQLMREFSDNEVSANARYQGKRVRITGAVDFVRVENGKTYARMSVPAALYIQLFCFFPQSQQSAVAAIQSGQQAVIEGTCRGVTSPGRLEMEECVLK